MLSFVGGDIQMSQKNLHKEAMKMLKETSRTFYIPITLLGTTLKNTVGSAYLCMRAIDEIEDHETMDPVVKQQLLRTTSELLKEPFNQKAYEDMVAPYRDVLPEGTMTLGDCVPICPEGILDTGHDYTRILATGSEDCVG